MTDIQTTTTTRFQCRHIFTDGHRCQSPNLRGENFCYYHHTTRQPVPKQELSRRKTRRATFHIPLPEDRSAIQHTIGEVLQRLASNDLDTKRAGLLLYGLQIASQNLPKPHPEAKPQPTIEEISQDPTHGPLAPITEFTADQEPKSSAELMLEKWAQRSTQQPATIPNIQAVAAKPQRRRRKKLRKLQNRPSGRSAISKTRLALRYLGVLNGRGERIRTSDPLVPNQVRYQTALRPEPLVVNIDLCKAGHNSSGCFA